MSGINKVMIIGNLGGDPDCRTGQSGVKVATISVATSEKWKDKSGDQHEKTEWHRIIFFHRLAEIVGEYLTKGSKVFVEGSLQTRKWTDKEGIDRWTTEIIGKELQMLGGGDKELKSKPERHKASTQEEYSADTFDDDIPF